MPVEFTCDGCNRRLRAPDAKAGKRTNCPTCGKELQIPVMSAGAFLSLPPAGAASASPIDQLASLIPSASEAAGFNLSQPKSGPAPLAPVPIPKAAAPAPKPSQPLEIGLADDESSQKPAPSLSPSISGSGSASGSAIGGSLKSKPNAWRGGDKMPAMPAGPAAPRPAMPNTAPNTPQINLPQAEPSKPSIPNLNIPAAAKPSSPQSPGLQLPNASTPTVPKPTVPKPGSPFPASPLSIPMATAAPASPLVPVAPVAPTAPTAPNPLDDIFKDLPQLAPVSAPAPQSFPSNGPIFGGLKPVTAADPFQAQSAALPTTTPNWSQVASTANVGGGNPYAAPTLGASAGYRRNTNIESVRTMVMIPGIFLLISFIFLLLSSIANVVGSGIQMLAMDSGDPEEGARAVGSIVGALIGFVLSIAGLFGAIKMIRLRSRGAALTASILAIFPFYFCLPIGIWAVIVLSMENVRNAFEANDRRAERGM